jgi:uncharacterized membrane protein YhaH (DUF805 family)
LTPEQRSRFAWWASVRGWVATRGKLSRRQLLLSLIPIFGFTGLLSGAELPVFVAVPLVVPLACLAAFVFVLRLRDADMHPAFVLLGLIPLLGWAGLAALLTYPTAGQKNTYTGWQSFLTGAAPFLTMALIASVIAPAAGVSPDSPTAVVESGEQSSETEFSAEDGFDPGAEGGPNQGPAEDAGSGVFTGEEDPVEGEATDDGVVDQAPVEEAPVEEAPPAPPVAGTASGLEGLVSQLRVEPEFVGGYNRDLFRHWIDADGDGCDTRREVLIAESLTPVSVGARCSLSGGSWYSAFDGVTTTDASSFDIDHFVPLKEAWDSGAHGWDSVTRQRFANDLDYAGSLIAVSASSNRSKGASDPAEWMPPNRSYWCVYLVTWVEVKIRWNLSADSSEVAAIRSAGAGC